jgi:hypothetical protein
VLLVTCCCLFHSPEVEALLRAGVVLGVLVLLLMVLLAVLLMFVPLFALGLHLCWPQAGAWCCSGSCCCRVGKQRWGLRGVSTCESCPQGRAVQVTDCCTINVCNKSCLGCIYQGGVAAAQVQGDHPGSSTACLRAAQTELEGQVPIACKGIERIRACTSA